jgi:UPF0755 protein
MRKAAVLPPAKPALRGPERRAGREKPPAVPRSLRGVLRGISVLITFVLLGAALAAGVLFYLNAPPEKAPSGILNTEALRVEDGAALVEVRNGESARSVGRRLEDAGVIKSRYFWNLISRLNPDFIKAGVYRIAIPASQLEIRAILVEGKQILTRVTVPEGLTLKKTARIFADAGICGDEAFLEAAADPDIRTLYAVPGETMEGYLYPDTYLFPQSYPAPGVVKTMADTFFRRIREIRGSDQVLPSRELNRLVTLASIVEREYRVAEEAPLMAGVFFNRLKTGMRLQSCATVEYVITEIRGQPHPKVLYTRDTEIEDPYNTYVYPGLPPGPISSPGAVALKAVFDPAETDYFYFRLTDPGEGRHYFSRTLDDHIRGGVLYLKGASP